MTSDIDEVLSSIRERQSRLPAIQEEASGWYLGWYFHLRLHEELKRSERHELPMSVIGVLLHDVTSADDLALRLREAADLLLRSTDIYSQLSEHYLAICLPHTDADGASAVMEKLVRHFADFSPTLGRGTFPSDGDEADVLLARAFNRATFGPV